MQLIKGPTHNKGNTLDLFFSEATLFDSLYFDCQLLPGIPDHDMVLTQIEMPNTRYKADHGNNKLKYNFKRANFEEINGLFSSLFSQLSDNTISSGEQWDMFKDTVLYSLYNLVPALLARPRGKPWMSRNLIRDIRKRDRAYKVFRLYPTDKNRNTLESLKKGVKMDIKEAKSNYLEVHVTDEMQQGNTKPLYNLISKSRGQSNHIGCLSGTPPGDIADSFANFFSSVFQDNALPLPDFRLEAPPTHNMEKINITGEGIEKLIKNLDVRKATGPDNISSYCLKEFSLNVSKFVPCLVIIMQNSIDNAVIPKDWKTANVVPIFKSGRRDLPQNYRPVSLTSITSKMIEHIITSAMWKHIDCNDLINKNQHGFRKRFSTTTQLLDVIHHASRAFDNHRKYHIISFDFAKAFDKVPHNLLIHKLKGFEFHESIIKWIEQWLSERTSVVSVNNKSSSSFDITSGVPQGSVLGPLLFLIFINDMPLCVRDSHCRLYADDTLLGMDITDCDQARLQQNVTALCEWSVLWGMSFNPSKCLHMQLGKDQPDFKLYMGVVEIPQTKVLKYLGVFIQNDLKWHEQALSVVKKGNKALGLIKRCLFDASTKTKLLAFNTIVRPVLEYACQVWSPHIKSLVDKLETVQRRGVRWIFRLKPLDSVSECMRDNNIQQLIERRQDLDYSFIKKIEFGLYEIDLGEYISYNNSYRTRKGTINPHFTLDQFKFSFYNRVRPMIETGRPDVNQSSA